MHVTDDASITPILEGSSIFPSKVMKADRLPISPDNMTSFIDRLIDMSDLSISIFEKLFSLEVIILKLVKNSFSRPEA